MSTEFSLIKKYFTRANKHTDLGVGDDAALLTVVQGMQLVVSSDMLVAGTHFFHDAAPYDVGWKALAVNVSDMAAMGAQGKWATLAIALPSVDEVWLVEFSNGFFACADAFNIDLIGGDTTKGPLSISVTIIGEVPTNQALRRDGAKVGDDIWVSGSLGNAALALAILQKRYQIDANWQEDELEKWLTYLHKPQPRAAFGLALRGIVTSCIDVSDGLMADLGHILTASNLAAEIHLEKVPMSLYNVNHLFEPAIQKCVLAGGDDYELCFTAPPENRHLIKKISADLNLSISLIGNIHAGYGLVVFDVNNQPISIENNGYEHFA